MKPGEFNPNIKLPGGAPALMTPDGKIYARCQGCGKLVRINKPILGSLHICT